MLNCIPAEHIVLLIINCSIAMIMCRFAVRVRTLTTDAIVNESTDPMLLLKRYERQIKELKQELAMRDTLAGRSRMNYEDLTDLEVREVNQAVKRYIEGETDQAALPLDSMKKIGEVMRQMKNVYQSMRNEIGAHTQRTELDGEDSPRKTGRLGEEAEDAADGVGDVVEGTGFHVGMAPEDARPSAISRENTQVGDVAGEPSRRRASGQPGCVGRQWGWVGWGGGFGNANSACCDRFP